MIDVVALEASNQAQKLNSSQHVCMNHEFETKKLLYSLLNLLVDKRSSVMHGPLIGLCFGIKLCAMLYSANVPGELGLSFYIEEL